MSLIRLRKIAVAAQKQVDGSWNRYPEDALAVLEDALDPDVVIAMLDALDAAQGTVDMHLALGKLTPSVLADQRLALARLERLVEATVPQ
jgi:hypothetical protein